MSVNRYNASTGELTNIASGQRTWVGTRAAYKAAKQAGTLPNNAIIAITDDEVDHNHYSTDEVETGMYWIDGKPIYRKVVRKDSANWNAAGWVLLSSDPWIATVDNFVNANIIGRSSNMPITVDGVHFSIFNNSELKYYTFHEITADAGSYAIFEYTKTTD